MKRIIIMEIYILFQAIRAVHSYLVVNLVRGANLLNFIARTEICYSNKLNLKHCVCSCLYYFLLCNSYVTILHTNIANVTYTFLYEHNYCTQPALSFLLLIKQETDA